MRVLAGIAIFFVPTIVGLLFRLIPVDTQDATFESATWKDCWDAAGQK